MAEPRTQDQLFDKRVVNRFIDSEILKKKEYESFLKKMPDLESELQTLDVVTEAAESEASED